MEVARCECGMRGYCRWECMCISSVSEPTYTSAENVPKQFNPEESNLKRLCGAGSVTGCGTRSRGGSVEVARCECAPFHYTCVAEEKMTNYPPLTSNSGRFCGTN